MFDNPVKKREIRRHGEESATRAPSPLLVFGVVGPLPVGDLEGNAMLVKETFLGMQLECRAGSENLPANLSVPPRRMSSWQ